MDAQSAASAQRETLIWPPWSDIEVGSNPILHGCRKPRQPSTIDVWSTNETRPKPPITSWSTAFHSMTPRRYSWIRSWNVRRSWSFGWRASVHHNRGIDTAAASVYRHADHGVDRLRIISARLATRGETYAYQEHSGKRQW